MASPSCGTRISTSKSPPGRPRTTGPSAPPALPRGRCRPRVLLVRDEEEGRQARDVAQLRRPAGGEVVRGGADTQVAIELLVRQRGGARRGQLGLPDASRSRRSRGGADRTPGRPLPGPSRTTTDRRPSRREPLRGPEGLAPLVLDRGIPPSRVADDRPTASHDEPHRVASPDLERDLVPGAFRVPSLDLGAPDRAVAVADLGSDPVAVEVRLEDPAAHDDAPVRRRREPPDARRPLAGVVPVAPHAGPFRTGPVGRPVPEVLPVTQPDVARLVDPRRTEPPAEDPDEVQGTRARPAVLDDRVDPDRGRIRDAAGPPRHDEARALAGVDARGRVEAMDQRVRRLVRELERTRPHAAFGGRKDTSRERHGDDAEQDRTVTNRMGAARSTGPSFLSPGYRRRGLERQVERAPSIRSYRRRATAASERRPPAAGGHSPAPDVPGWPCRRASCAPGGLRGPGDASSEPGFPEVIEGEDGEDPAGLALGGRGSRRASRGSAGLGRQPLPPWRESSATAWGSATTPAGPSVRPSSLPLPRSGPASGGRFPGRRPSRGRTTGQDGEKPSVPVAGRPTPTARECPPGSIVKIGRFRTSGIHGGEPPRAGALGGPIRTGRGQSVWVRERPRGCRSAAESRTAIRLPGLIRRTRSESTPSGLAPAPGADRARQVPNLDRPGPALAETTDIRHI